MKNYNRILSLCMALCLTLLLGGCGGTEKDNEPGAAKGIKMQLEIPADPGTLGPYTGYSPARNEVIFNIYESLFVRNSTGKGLEPSIGESYEKVSATTYKIKIFENVHDSENNHITAEDVVFSYETGMATGVLSNWCGNVVSVKALNEYTVEMELNSDLMGIFESMVNFLPIVSKAAFEADGNDMSSTPVGTGAYKLKKWTTGSSIVLEKNENYWQDTSICGEVHACEEIEYIVISEPAQVTISLETGVVDFAYDVQTNDLEYFMDGGINAKEFTVGRRSDGRVISAFFDCSEGSIFNDVKLRQAVAYAIDANAVKDAVYGELGHVASGYGTPCYGDYQKEWEDQDYYGYNPEKAKELMKDAGYADGFSIKIMTNSLAENKNAAQVIQSYLREVGIEAKIDSYETALFNTYKYDANEYDIFINRSGATDYVVTAWRFVFDADAFKGETINHYNDAEYQKLLREAMNSDTHSEATVNTFWQYNNMVVPVYSLCYSDAYTVYANGIEPFVNSEGIVFPGRSTFTSEFAN